MEKLCHFSPDRVHRFTLWRDVSMFDTRFVQFIGLNPSTADETQDDPTIRRCMGFVAQWGYGALCMTNLFSFRSPSPEAMKAAPEPSLDENWYWLQAVARSASLIICAWGNHGSFNGQAHAFLRFTVEWEWDVKLWCLRKTSKGQPEHPLYLPAELKPEPFNFSQN